MYIMHFIMIFMCFRHCIFLTHSTRGEIYKLLSLKSVFIQESISIFDFKTHPQSPSCRVPGIVGIKEVPKMADLRNRKQVGPYFCFGIAPLPLQPNKVVGEHSFYSSECQPFEWLLLEHRFMQAVLRLGLCKQVC